MSRLNIKPLSGCIGAEIHGIDLTKPITHELYLQLRGCLVEHEVIFFRDQDLTTEEHLRFGKYFGELEIHPFAPKKENFLEVLVITHNEKLSLIHI